MRKTPLSPILLCLFLASCRVGPDYHPPEVEMPDSYTEDILEGQKGIGDEELCRWWTLFNDPFLDQLLEETLQGNFDYRIALEQIYVARQQFWITFTQILPAIMSDAQATHYRASQSFASQAAATTAISPTQNFFQAGFDAVWELDFFGGLRRNADAAYDTFEAAEETSRDVKITVLSEVANTYVLINTFQKKTALAEEIVLADVERLSLVRSLFESGLASEQEMASAIAILETDRAVWQSYLILLKQNIYSLAVLVGRTPESLAEDFRSVRPIPEPVDSVPAALHAGLPGDLLRRRPDIRAAERELASATEQIGVAVAALYPTFNLIGSSSSFASNPLQGANAGYSADHLKNLFTSPSAIWGYGTLITWPIFDFGNRMANVKAHWHIEHQAYLNYQKTIITALQEVEQALAAYFHEEERLRGFTREVEANRRIWELVLDEFQSGLVDDSQTLQAKEVWLTAINAMTDSRQALTSDLIALYKALGGDW